jgi:hypothetical protein
VISWQLTIPYGAKDAAVFGTFSAAGGKNNDVMVALLDDGENFLRFERGMNALCFWQSGFAQSGTLKTRLSPGTTYHVAVSNHHSLVSSKVVQIRVIYGYVPQ